MPRLPGASPGKKKGRAQRGEKAAMDKGVTKPAAPMAPAAKPVAPAAAATTTSGAGGDEGGSQAMAAAAMTVAAPVAAEERAAKPLELTAARLRLICPS